MPGMPRKPFQPGPPAPPRDAKIRELETSLYLARNTFIDLMPPPLQATLEANIWCDSFDALHEWQDWAVGAVIDAADKQPGCEMGDDTHRLRAFCPLCGEGATSAYGPSGYLIPTGLSRHLEGSHRTRRCHVFAAAWKLAAESARESEAGTGPHFQGLLRSEPPWRIFKPVVPPAPAGPKATVIHLRGPKESG